MKKKVVVALIIILISLVGVTIYNYSFTEFEPLIFEKHEFNEVVVDKKFYENLELVLKYYKEDYEVSNFGTIRIRRKLSRDKELISNYTKKAMDTAWLKSHFVQ